MSKKITTEEFVRRSINIHGDRYDYSLVEYRSMKEKVLIRCERDHFFEMTPDNHLRSRGCSYCSGRNNTVNNIKGFIEKSNIIHKNKYDYSKFKYTRSIDKGVIICKEHGEFEQSPNSHLSGSGCRKCYDNSLCNDSIYFIDKSLIIHGDRYDYSLVEYKNNKTKVKIICKEHGEFEQMPTSHLSGSGCKCCMKDKFRVDFSEFVKRSNDIHGDKYEYLKDSYYDMRTVMNIKCKIHGIFKSTPDNHISKKEDV